MLLAQAAPAGSGWLVVALLVGAGLAVAALIVLGMLLIFRHSQADRKLTHTERMRSLEAGIPLEPTDAAKTQAKFLHNAFWISFWLVTAVPSAAFTAATTATQEMNRSLALAIVIWSGAAAASVAAVICATVLMIYSRSGQLAGFLKRLLGS